MTVRKTFEQEAVDDATTALEGLIEKHPELRGAAVTFEWTLPRVAAEALTVGLYRTRDGQITPSQCAIMQQQLASLSAHIGAVAIQMTQEVSVDYNRMVGALKEAQGPDPSADGEVTPPVLPTQEDITGG